VNEAVVAITKIIWQDESIGIDRWTWKIFVYNMWINGMLEIDAHRLWEIIREHCDRGWFAWGWMGGVCFLDLNNCTDVRKWF